jgi:hypothetical protein
MVDIFTTLVQNLNAMGFYGFVLPFLLVFAIVYALLIQSNVFGKQKGPIGVISLVIGFFVTAFTGIGTYLIALFGISTMFWAALLVVILFFAFFGYTSSADYLKNFWFIVLLAVLALIIVLVMGGAALVPSIVLNEGAMAAILMVVIIGLAVWFVMCGAPCEKKA